MIAPNRDFTPVRSNLKFNSEALSLEEIRAKTPSVFAVAPHDDVSERYSFIPTSRVLEALQGEGWMPVKAFEQKALREDKKGFQKHMIRLARVDDLRLNGPQRPELVLVNSHDRSSSFQLHAGIFRLVCTNGMVIADATFAKISVPHVHNTVERVVNGSVDLLREIPALTDRVNQFQSIQLSDRERQVFAEAALMLRWEEPELAPIHAEKLLVPRRSADSARDLWTTFNVIQENAIKGGLRDGAKLVANSPRFRRAPKSRGITGLDENVRLNKALWHLAEALKETKS